MSGVNSTFFSWKYNYVIVQVFTFKNIQVKYKSTQGFSIPVHD